MDPKSLVDERGPPLPHSFTQGQLPGSTAYSTILRKEIKIQATHPQATPLGCHQAGTKEDVLSSKYGGHKAPGIGSKSPVSPTS